MKFEGEAPPAFPPAIDEASGESDTPPEFELERPLVCACGTCDGVLSVAFEDGDFWLDDGLGDEALGGSGVAPVCDEAGTVAPPIVAPVVPPVVFPVPVPLPLGEALVFPAAETEPTDALPVPISFTAL